MTLPQIAVSFICLVVGYVLVSWLMDRRSDSKPSTPAEPSVTLANWYRVLGIAERAGKDEIMRAYEQQIARNLERRAQASEPAARAACDAEAARLRAAYAMGMRLYN